MTNSPRLELLLFHLNDAQVFAIDISGVKEVLACPDLTRLPHSHAAVCGVFQLRGVPLTVVDLAHALGRRQLDGSAMPVIITEFMDGLQGFMVGRVDRIIACEASEMQPPPAGSGNNHYIAGVVERKDVLVQVLDFERILSEALGRELFQQAA